MKKTYIVKLEANSDLVDNFYDNVIVEAEDTEEAIESAKKMYPDHDAFIIDTLISRDVIMEELKGIRQMVTEYIENQPKLCKECGKVLNTGNESSVSCLCIDCL